jgi:hypothetical protein
MIAISSCRESKRGLTGDKAVKQLVSEGIEPESPVEKRGIERHLCVK